MYIDLALKHELVICECDKERDTSSMSFYVRTVSNLFSRV